MPFSQLTHKQLQCCHFRHLQRVPNTRNVEAAGRALMAPGVAHNAASLLAFSQQVCRWGGKTGGRVFGRIRKNPPNTIAKGFTAAIAELRVARSDLLAAKKALRPIKGLGSFSYSSKHLRMMSPEISPVLDSLVDRFLVTNSARYANSTIEQRFLGYADFCQTRADQLTRDGVTLGDFLVPAHLGTLKTTNNPLQCKWTAADIDMACFAWLQGWCAAAGAVGTKNTSRRVKASPSARGLAADKVATGGAGRNQRPLIFLAQDHKRDTAVTIKEECGWRWNNAWICRRHGSLDFKNPGARGTTRHLISEILQQGVDVTQDADWEPSDDGTTCHHDGVDYQGRLCLGSVADAVRYLKRFFDVRACHNNSDETQAWIDAL